MKKTLLFIITIAITYCIAFAMGRNEVILTKEPIGAICINYKEAYLAEKQHDWEDFYHYETPLMWESITYSPGYSY